MNTPFKNIALFGKPNPAIRDTLQVIYDYLLEQGINVLLEEATATLLGEQHPSALPIAELAGKAELAIAIGGDGTFLSAARAFSAHDVPLIGVNMGRLGFLVDISPADLPDKLEPILVGDYHAEERYLLQVRIIRDGHVIHQQNAMNEVVIHRWVTPEMIHMKTTIDGAFLNDQRSDGMIISTPTGSTAYALSGGGPILFPTQNVMLLVPINPHTLSHRPIIIGADSEVEVSFYQNTHMHAQISCDEISIPDVTINDRILVSKAPKKARILHPSDYDFFHTLRTKLHWSI